MKHSPLNVIMPYLMIALMIVVFIFSLFIFSYVLIFAVVLGLIAFVGTYLRTRFFKPKTPNRQPHQHQGRIIDQEKD